MNGEDPELWIEGNDAGDGLQTGSVSREEVEEAQGYERLGEVITVVVFEDGKRVSDQSGRSAA